MSTRIERQSLKPDEFIHRDPHVHGGYPVVAGTRTPVASIVVLSRDVYPGKPRKIQESLPHLTLAQIKAALAYYEEHRDVVDEDILRDEAAWDVLVVKGWPRDSATSS